MCLSHKGCIAACVFLINHVPHILAAFVLCYHSITMRWEKRRNYSGSESAIIFDKVHLNVLWELFYTPEADTVEFNIKVTVVGSIAFSKRKRLRPRIKKARGKHCGVFRKTGSFWEAHMGNGFPWVTSLGTNISMKNNMNIYL